MTQQLTRSTLDVAALAATPALARIGAGGGATPLDQLVAAVLGELVAAGVPFTAYEVTGILRALFPAGVRAIPHYPDGQGEPGVRALVHTQMEQHVQAGCYRRRTVYPAGGVTGSAVGYFPARHAPGPPAGVAGVPGTLPRRVRVLAHLLPPGARR